VDGVLTSVSQDILTDPATQQPYYLARAVVTPEGLKALGSRQMQPGMPAEVIIKTGSRTMLNYLLHPLTKRVAASLKEE
jgi:protease secretion system membrane fusion protein